MTAEINNVGMTLGKTSGKTVSTVKKLAPGP